jgi:hypothetical protein
MEVRLSLVNARFGLRADAWRSIVRQSPLANKPETEHAGDSAPPPIPGLITSETATAVTLKRQEGKEDFLLRSEIEAMAGSGQSLMPRDWRRT